MMLIVPVPLRQAQCRLWNSRPWALPFLTLNAPSEATNQANGKRHKTSIDWIKQMVCLVRRWLRGRALVVVTDGGLTAVKLGLTCGALRQPVTWVSRLRLDVGLYDGPGEQPKEKRGPKPKKGKRLTSLQARFDDPLTAWCQTEIDWYGGRQYTIEYVTGQALWYTPGFDPLPIRWVLVRDPAGKYKATAFLCTDLTADPLQILQWFILRWNVEITFEEARAQLGLGYGEIYRVRPKPGLCPNSRLCFQWSGGFYLLFHLKWIKSSRRNPF